MSDLDFSTFCLVSPSLSQNVFGGGGVFQFRHSPPRRPEMQMESLALIKAPSASRLGRKNQERKEGDGENSRRRNTLLLDAAQNTFLQLFPSLQRIPLTEPAGRRKKVIRQKPVLPPRLLRFYMGVQHLCTQSRSQSCIALYSRGTMRTPTGD